MSTPDFFSGLLMGCAVGFVIGLLTTGWLYLHYFREYRELWRKRAEGS